MFFSSFQYFYSLRIFAGQDPSCVWVGWVTPDYHFYSEDFDLNKNCTVTVTLGDERGRVHERYGFIYHLLNIVFYAVVQKQIIHTLDVVNIN